jgi:HNH endonuclease
MANPYPRTPEHRRASSVRWRATVTRLWQDPEYRRKQSASRKLRASAQWQDPAIRAEMSRSLKRRWQDPDVRAQHSRSVKRQWQDPDVRAKHLASWTPERRRAHREGRSGSNNGRWQGGWKINAYGYRMIRVSGGYRREHRIIAERALGRPLARDEVVHHIDGNKLRNEGNLLICTKSFHHWLEARIRRRRTLASPPPPQPRKRRRAGTEE